MNHINYLDQLIYPSKIVCVGRNYVEHIKELGNKIPQEMVLFLKPNSAIGYSLLANKHEEIHYEAELCFLYQRGRFVAMGIGLDLTKRQLQGKLKDNSLPWERAKAFDGSALFSQFIDLTENMDDVTFELHINHKLTQQGNIGLMIYSPDEILKEIQTFMTLIDGDIVMTGTPKGVGKISPRQIFTVSIKDSSNQLLTNSWEVK